jgi:hypothetical protein
MGKTHESCHQKHFPARQLKGYKDKATGNKSSFNPMAVFRRRTVCGGITLDPVESDMDCSIHVHWPSRLTTLSF